MISEEHAPEFGHTTSIEPADQSGDSSEVASAASSIGLTETAKSQLSAGKVIILGASASGITAGKSLIKAGVGHILVVDSEAAPLTEAAESLNDHAESYPQATIAIRKENLNPGALERLIEAHHIVVDALSDWQDKLLVSDVCMSVGRPLIHSGVIGFRLQIYSMLPKKSACLRCALPLAGIDDVPRERPANITIGAVAEMVGSWQSIEVVKLLARIGATQGNELFKFDTLSGEFEIIRGLDPHEDCPDCGPTLRKR